MCGVSAGAIVSTATICGVPPADQMNVIHRLAEVTKAEGGFFDVFQPGFSLVDYVKKELNEALQGDDDLFLQRTDGGRLLRIGLTNRRKIDIAGAVKARPKAFVFVDGYRDIEDVVAACVLSSYIPLGTGPLLGASDPFDNSAVRHANKRIKEMEGLGFLKHHGESTKGTPVSRQGQGQEGGEGEDYSVNRAEKNPDDVIYWDGGLSNNWPIVDNSTVIVTPLNGSFLNPSITPPFHNAHDTNDSMPFSNLFKPPSHFDANEQVKLGINGKNLDTLYRMTVSSHGSTLDTWFSHGYDDTRYV